MKKTDTERLQKFLAKAGVASRRKAENLILEGLVTINGKVAKLGEKVGKADVVKYKGKLVKKQSSTVTYMLNKPRGFISSVNDDMGRKTVMNLVPKHEGLHPVGRLDKNSEGLLLITNDGSLTLKLTHPRYKHEKEYWVWAKEGDLSREAIRALKQGVELEDGWARAKAAKPLKGGVVIILSEGRKRQVRRMLSAVGYNVIKLERRRIAKLWLGDLKRGDYRVLTTEDFKLLGYTL